MTRKVLAAGNCSSDYRMIRRVIRKNFRAETKAAADAEETLERMTAERFDLVLVNRKLYADGDDGVSLIERIKRDGRLASIPVMLISNHAEAQERAVSVGAERGFGKAALKSDETRDILARFLA